MTRAVFRTRRHPSDPSIDIVEYMTLHDSGLTSEECFALICVLERKGKHAVATENEADFLWCVWTISEPVYHRKGLS
jgi:hypothetical protein